MSLSFKKNSSTKPALFSNFEVNTRSRSTQNFTSSHKSFCFYSLSIIISMMSTFFSTVTDTGVTVPDETTLMLKHFGGTVTMFFQDCSHLMSVADAILAALASTPTPGGNTKPDGITTFKGDVSPATAASNAASDEDSLASGSNSEASGAQHAPPPEESDSSFESYDGHGLTQEINFWLNLAWSLFSIAHLRLRINNTTLCSTLL